MGHVSRMPQGWLPKQTLYAEVSGKRPLEDCLYRGSWLEPIGLHPSKIQSLLVNRMVRRLNLKLLPSDPQEKVSEEKKRKE